MQEKTKGLISAFALVAAMIVGAGALVYVGTTEGWFKANPYKRHQAEVERRCMEEIEAMAAHRFRWLADEDARFNLHRGTYGPDGNGSVEGDQIEMMNGYGAWFKYQYRCRLADDGDPAPRIWKVKG